MKTVKKKPSVGASSEIEEDIPMASSQGKDAFGDDEVEEDIRVEEDGDDQYSDDYEQVSEQIGESLPSKANRVSKTGSSGIIEESIPESLPGSKGKEESITEEDHLKRSVKSATIDESIVDEVGASGSVIEDDISEESHLKSPSVKKPKAPPAKVERARDNIKSDFERDG